jgi:hypothetical protein
MRRIGLLHGSGIAFSAGAGIARVDTRPPRNVGGKWMRRRG